MVMVRGEIWWADLPQPIGSVPGKRRPVLVLQNDLINRSSIDTVILASITSNLALGKATGNVLLEKRDSSLDRPSVVNLSQIVTVNKSWLTEIVGMLRKDIVERVDQGLRVVFDLR
jgi:mRNA interferase MazF